MNKSSQEAVQDNMPLTGMPQQKPVRLAYAALATLVGGGVLTLAVFGLALSGSSGWGGALGAALVAIAVAALASVTSALLAMLSLANGERLKGVSIAILVVLAIGWFLFVNGSMK